MRCVSVVLSLSACDAAAPLSAPSREQLAREAMEDPAVPAVPDCSLAARCPELELDPRRCTDDPALFRVAMLGALVSDVEPIEELIDAQRLAPGTWHTLFADPMGGCDHVIFSFEVDSAAQVDGGAP